jgi:hypothetical protein
MKNICDHKDCPAAATHAILTPSGIITLCTHHTCENAVVSAGKGYRVYHLDTGAELEKVS